MSFWKGFAQAYKDVDEKKTREKLIAEEREWATQQKAEDRTYESSEFDRRFQMQSRQSVFETLAKRTTGSTSRGQAASSQAVTWLQGRLAGAEGAEDLLAQAITNPALAEQIMKSVMDAEEKAAATGNQNPRLSGDALVSQIEIYGAEGIGLENIPTQEDVMAAYDTGDMELFYSLVQHLEQGPSSAVDINPSIYYQPNITEQRYRDELRGRYVLDNARRRLMELSEPGMEAEYASLAEAIENYESMGANAESIYLDDLFGDIADQQLDERFSRESIGEEELPEETIDTQTSDVPPPPVVQQAVEILNQGGSIIITQEILDWDARSPNPQLQGFSVGDKISKGTP